MIEKNLFYDFNNKKFIGSYSKNILLNLNNFFKTYLIQSLSCIREIFLKNKTISFL